MSWTTPTQPLPKLTLLSAYSAASYAQPACQGEPALGRDHPLLSPTQHPQLGWQPALGLARALATGLMAHQLQHSNSSRCCRAGRNARGQAQTGASKLLEINTRSEVQQVQSRELACSPKGFGPNCSLVWKGNTSSQQSPAV